MHCPKRILDSMGGDDDELDLAILPKSASAGEATTIWTPMKTKIGMTTTLRHQAKSSPAKRDKSLRLPASLHPQESLGRLANRLG